MTRIASDSGPLAGRFVVLRHLPGRAADANEHWDLMLDLPTLANPLPLLATWSLPSLPPSAGEIVARRLADHRRVFLVYEGPLSGERGSVVRCDAGAVSIRSRTEDELVFECHGEWMKGQYSLRRLKTGSEWRLEAVGE